MTRTWSATVKTHLQESLMKFRQGDIPASELLEQLDEYIQDRVHACLVKREREKMKDVPTAPAPVTEEKYPSPKKETEPLHQPSMPEKKGRFYIRILGPKNATMVTVGKRYLSFDNGAPGLGRSPRYIFNDAGNQWWLPPVGDVIEPQWPLWEYASEENGRLFTHLQITGYNKCTLTDKPKIGSVHKITGWDDGCPQIRYKNRDGLIIGLTLSYYERGIDPRNLSRISWTEIEAPKDENPIPKAWIRVERSYPGLTVGQSYPVIGLSAMTYGDPIVANAEGNPTTVKNGEYSHSIDPAKAKVKDKNGVVLQPNDLAIHELELANSKGYPRVIVSTDPWILYFTGIDRIHCADPSGHYVFRGRATEDQIKKAQVAFQVYKGDCRAEGV